MINWKRFLNRNTPTPFSLPRMRAAMADRSKTGINQVTAIPENRQNDQSSRENTVPYLPTGWEPAAPDDDERLTAELAIKEFNDKRFNVELPRLRLLNNVILHAAVMEHNRNALAFIQLAEFKPRVSH